MKCLPSPRPALAAIGLAALLFSACGASDSSATEATTAATELSNPASATSPPASSPPASSEPAPATTATSTTTTTTTEPPCEVKCPVAEEERAVIQGSIDAYNSHDWQRWLASVADDEPAFATPVGPQTPALVEFDFIWSTAMSDIWTLGECLETRGAIKCDVTMEDDLHRALAIAPSECSVSMTIKGDLADWTQYNLFPCHSEYDVAMHQFGEWFLANNPGVDSIWGHHYRGWNQQDTTAGARAAEALDEYVATLTETTDS